MASDIENCLIQKGEQSPDCMTPVSSNSNKSDQFETGEDGPRFKDVLYQIVISSVTSFTVLQAGLNMAYSSVLLEQLENDENYKINKTEESWIASLAVLTTPIGSLLCGPVMDKMGRKPGILIASFVSVIGWILMLLATPSFYLPLILLSRFLGGLGGGMTTISLIYIPEVCHEKYRPMMLGTNSIVVSLGVLLVTLTGYFLKWKMMAFGFCIVILINMCLLWIYMPESPIWLLTIKMNRNLAEKSLLQLNPNEEMYDRQLMYLNNLNKRRLKVSNTGVDEVRRSKTQKLKLIFLQFFSPPAKLPILILIGLLTLQQLCGGYTIIFYTIQVFQMLGRDFGAGINEYTALLIMGILRFLFSIVSAGVSLCIGRKTLLLVSAVGMAASSILIPFNHYILLDESESGHWPVIFVLVFVSFTALGIMNIPWTLIGELLPLSVRGTGSGFLVSFAYLLMFTFVKVFPFLLDILNIHLLFLIQGLVCILTALYIYIFVPETLGKSLHAIQEHFYANKISTSNS